MDSVLHLLGIARKAGRVEVGEEPVGAAARAHQAKLILTACDGADNSLRHPVTAKFIKVGKRAFATGQNDDIRFFQFIRIIGIEKMYARVTFQRVEIRKIAEMAQKHNGNVHLSPFRLHRLCGKSHRIFLFYINILIIRHYTHNGNTA